MLFSQDIGIDLGTSTTSVCVKGKGIIYSEPTVAAVRIGNDKSLVAVGQAAKDMIGRTPGSVALVRPIRGGVIADYSVTTGMLRLLIKKSMGKSWFSRTRLMISVPSGLTEVERRAVHMAAREAGARYVSIVESPMAAAIGAGLNVSENGGKMIVDLGGGCIKIAVMSFGDIVISESVRIGGDDFDDAVIEFLKKNHNIVIGQTAAEDIKIKMGYANGPSDDVAMNIKGRSTSDGLPKSELISSENLRFALTEPLRSVVFAIKNTFSKLPPELAADILGSGIVLTGGLAALRGLPGLISHEVKVPVNVADEPQKAVINGMLRLLNEDFVGENV